MNKYRHLPKSPVYENGYVSATVDWPWGVEQTTIVLDAPYDTDEQDIDDSPVCSSHNTTILDVALSPDGHYIGSVEDAQYLWTKYGIIPELVEGNKTCSIGKGRDGKWYGWSHRAVHGFQVGDTVKPGDCAYVPSTVEEVYDSLYVWHGDPGTRDLTLKVEQQDDKFKVDVNYAIQVRDGSRPPIRSEQSYTIPKGLGTWTAKTESDAKRMAMDFAESVSSSDITSEYLESCSDVYLLHQSEFLVAERLHHRSVRADGIVPALHFKRQAAIKLSKHTFFDIRTSDILEDLGVDSSERRTDRYELIGIITGFKQVSKMVAIKLKVVGITRDGKKFKVVGKEMTLTVPDDYPVYTVTDAERAHSRNMMYIGDSRVLYESGRNMVVHSGDILRIESCSRTRMRIARSNIDCVYSDRIDIDPVQVETLRSASIEICF